MAVVSKEEIRVFGRKFDKVVKYSAKTEQFTIVLPEEVQKKHRTEIHADSLSSVNELFLHTIQSFKEANTRQEKVLMVCLRGTIEGKSPITDKYCEMEDIGYSHEGVGVSFSCGVFDKFITENPDGTNDIDYIWLESKFPEGFHRLADEWVRANDDYIELPWTKEDEMVLVELACALRLLTFKLLAVCEGKSTLKEFVRSGRKLLPGWITEKLNSER